MLVIAIQKRRAVERAHLKAMLQKSASRPFTIHFNSSLQNRYRCSPHPCLLAGSTIGKGTCPRCFRLLI